MTKNESRILRVMLIICLGLGLCAACQVVSDPAMSIGWKTFFICAAAPAFLVLLFLLAVMQEVGKYE